MMAWLMKTLKLHYLIIQFLIIINIFLFRLVAFSPLGDHILTAVTNIVSQTVSYAALLQNLLTLKIVQFQVLLTCDQLQILCSLCIQCNWLNTIIIMILIVILQSLSVIKINNLQLLHLSVSTSAVIGQFCRPYFTVWPANFENFFFRAPN